MLLRSLARRSALAGLVVVSLGLAESRPAAAQIVHEVAVAPGGTFSYSPSEWTILQGETVRWTWMASFHTVTSGTAGIADGVFDSGPPAGTAPGDVFEFTFLEPGTYPYFCQPHWSFGMTGTITVLGGPMPVTFRRGDCNDDGGFDIADGIFALDVLFSGGGPAPCDDACDGNDDGALDIADVIYFLANLFTGGPPPPQPYPDCDVDTTDDALDCVGYASICP